MLRAESTAFIFCIGGSLVIIPFFIGFSMVKRNEDFARFAGWMTLKPVLGTFLLLLSFFVGGRPYSQPVY